MSRELKRFNPLKLTPEQLERIDPIAQIQAEVQKEYCPTCEHYDPKKGDFKEKGNPRNSQDCKYHFTDTSGECFNYRGPLVEEIEGPSIDEVYGRRVRLMADYTITSEIIAAIKAGLIEGFKASDDLKISRTVLKGALGTICKVQQTSGIFNYAKEWPVQFDSLGEGISLGVPHELLEFLDDEKGKVA